MRRTKCALAVGMLAWVASVRATDLLLTIVEQSSQSANIVVAPGTWVTYEIIGVLEPVGGEGGLALWGANVDFLEDADVANHEGLAAPSDGSMDAFVLSAGLTNPVGYEGVVFGNSVLQVGGGQNTIANTVDMAPYPIGAVDTGVAAMGPQVLAEGVYWTPPDAAGETHVISLSSCFANVLIGDLTGPVYAVEAAPSSCTATLTIQIYECDDGNPCTEDTWDGEQCVHTPFPNGTPCPDDGDPCTWDTCSGGSCAHPVCEGCPVISRQPQCLAVPVGADATFSVGVNPSIGNAQVEWFRNDVSAGTGFSLTIPDVQPEDHNTRVYCRVTDDCGTNDSYTVLLAVDINVVFGDADGDCDVDLADFAAFQRCFTESPPSTACLVTLDLDDDDNFDLDDYALFAGELGSPEQRGCPYSDTWSTDPANETLYDFGTNGRTIPADFFEPGSDPFAEQVVLIGVGADPDNLGGTDTQVAHAALRFPAYEGHVIEREVDAELASLSLAGKEPIIVTSNGVEEEWLIAVSLSVVEPPETGVITARLTHSNGGLFDATVYVQPLFLFAHAQDVEDFIDGLIQIEDIRMRVLDTGLERQNLIVLQFTDQPFSITIPEELNVYPGPCAMGDFVPGVDTSRGRATPECAEHITPDEKHYFCPTEKWSLCKCTYDLWQPLPSNQCPTIPQRVRTDLCTNGIEPEPDGTCPDADPPPPPLCRRGQVLTGACPDNPSLPDYEGIYRRSEEEPCTAVRLD